LTGRAQSGIRLILYSRSWCHLCDDMLAAVRAFAPAASLPLEVVDVDDDPDLVALYDELVPVLAVSADGGRAHRLCHYFFEPGALLAFLENPRRSD
jgi:hypothetical protein